MAGWNYAVLSFQMGRDADPTKFDLDFTHPPDTGSLAGERHPSHFSALRALGDAGWELVSVVVDQHDQAALYLKLHM